MKLRRLLVTNFAAVPEIDIHFGPGLNVLYGPNDLGKSTLVEAIRLALLLPHGSESSEKYVRWTAAHDPVVELTFETEPQQIWRVRKEFRKAGGSSLLQVSKDGQDFDDVERARKVDGKLREILSWGIPEPGGVGGTKGVPSSFLATALLSTQADVTAMLTDSLATDKSTSGKERIAAALQTVAQDPLFVQLLRNVQARRDEAYTDKGSKKASKGSAFKLAADRVRETREEKERLQKVVSDSEGTEKLLQTLNDDRVQRNDALTTAKARVVALERLATQAADRAAAAEQVRLAEENTQRIRKLGFDVEEAQKTADELVEVEEGARQALAVAQKQKLEADALVKSAEETSRTEGLDSADGDAIRPQIELRIAAAEKATAGAQLRIDAATAAQKLVDAVADTERDHLDQQAKALSAQKSMTEAVAKEEAAKDDLRHCDLLEKALDFRSAEKEVAAAHIAVDKHSTSQTRLESALEECAALAGKRADTVVPAPTALAPMRQLATDLAAARGALDVGFVVTVIPKHSLDMTIRKDTHATDSVSTAKPVEIEADAEVAFEIADLVSVHIRGGRREAQKKLRALEKRWELEVAPHLAAVGSPDLPGLEAKVVEDQNMETDIKAKNTEIDSLRTQINSLGGEAGALERALKRLEDCRSALGNMALDALSADLGTLGADPLGGLRKRRQRSSQAVDSARSISSQATNDATIAEERARNSQSLLEAATARRDLALTSFPQGVAEALKAGQSDLAAAAKEALVCKAELESLNKTIELRKARIDEAVAGARANCEKARIALEAAQETLTEAMTNRAAQVGQLTQLRKARDAEDLGAAETKLREATERHTALPVPKRPVTKDELDTANSVEASLSLALETVERDIQRAHGALQQVGGAVARERLRDAIEAFELAEQYDREIESDYEAWKLLLDQMKEADAAQASNLGLTLAPAIASGFQALTDRRYETVKLTASLGTEGVVVAGTVRPSDRMSVGTREQLSTLYRLSLAEYLQTVVVLDDQLVQSDESRMDWFRALLKEKSQSFQILVFTCRPRDYLEKSSMVPKGKSLHADTNSGFIRAIDLGRALGRSK